MALRTSMTLLAGVTLLGLMYQSISRQAETTNAVTNDAAFNGSRAIMQDLLGLGGSTFPMLMVVAFIAGGLGVALLIK